MLDTFRSSSAVNSPILGAWVWQIDTDRVTAWPSLASLLCLDAETLRMGVSLDQFLSAVHPADREGIDVATKIMSEHRTPIDQTFRVITAGLGVRWIRLQGFFHADRDGRHTQMTGVISETSDSQKRPEVLIVENLIEARRHAVSAHKQVLSKLIEATLYEAGLELASMLRKTFADHPGH